MGLIRPERLCPESSPPAPILYSFRRCPYAIRARLALFQAGITVRIREVNLRNRPPELLEVSPAGTVPVLVIAELGSAVTAITESLDIMRWACQRQGPLQHSGAGLQPGSKQDAAKEGGLEQEQALIDQNDGPFKHHLDRTKYPDRFPGEDSSEHRQAALAILRQWNRALERGDAPIGTGLGLADLALLPFVRQFRLIDAAAFDREVALEALQLWLKRFLESPLFQAVMAPPLAYRHPWRSPGWIYHLALPEHWQAARSEGIYRQSTRDQTLESVGFIHASHAHQLERTHGRFYADVERVLLLSIDPRRLARLGIPVVEEAAPESGELFPHIRGGLPVEAVLSADTYHP